MAFIVEIAWGKPPGLTVYGSDADGELVPIRYIPNEGPPDPEWREFSCCAWLWEHVLELGSQAGWKPLGTLPAESSHEDWTKHGRFDSSYEPSDWHYCKQFQSDDSAALADALQKVLDSKTALPPGKGPFLIREGMTEKELVASNRGVTESFLKEFIAFLRKGPFVFALDE